MKASVEGLQKEIFGSGWATVSKIGAGVTGIVMSIGGIHFFQKYTE